MTTTYPDGPYLLTLSDGTQEVFIYEYREFGDMWILGERIQWWLDSGATLTPLVPKTDDMNRMLLDLNKPPLNGVLYNNHGGHWWVQYWNYGEEGQKTTEWYRQPIEAVRAAWEAVTGGNEAGAA